MGGVAVNGAGTGWVVARVVAGWVAAEAGQAAVGMARAAAGSVELEVGGPVAGETRLAMVTLAAVQMARVGAGARGLVVWGWVVRRREEVEEEAVGSVAADKVGAGLAAVGMARVGAGARGWVVGEWAAKGWGTDEGKGVEGTEGMVREVRAAEALPTS